MEDAKKITLANIAKTNANVSGFVHDIETKLESSSNDMSTLLNRLIEAVNNKQLTVNTTAMSDNRKITINTRKSSDFIGEIALPGLLR